MHIEDLIDRSRVFVDVDVKDKRDLLAFLASRAGQFTDLDTEHLLDGLVKREELGSTGIGDGAAIPHVRDPGVAKPIGLFARLRRPVPYQAIDDQPVDLVCLLLLPTRGRGSEPLCALACVARRLRGHDELNELRQVSDAKALYERLVS
jgi:PTS system nitrogen regulatory IIA component